MTDYKELIAEIRNCFPTNLERRAADAIERLVKERDAAIKDLKHDGNCRCCKEIDICGGLSHGYCGGLGWEWRGVKEAEHEAD